ncbi:competence/damage-inducible protein A [Carboxylicivirga sp. M1479]|uniref:competence/damage-inducible protein A n=1 Tax=Carboxylicivirga sp. M1479 TaxID=2594476 RepID=UPI00117856A2|nr:competence/damage-inducible protein A [Carboxylicivirga sp. M1479]TRX70475.1 competence/damage-inducible protein A [Carboxylicivirga sp. M1479]
MNVEIITIGNELLIGQVIDTNSAWMGQELNKAGFDVSRITSIQDTASEISSTLNEAMLRADIILLTGGLGPTKDDITKETLAKLFDSELVFNQEAYDNMANFIKGRVKSINKLNRGQAYIPACCELINNPVGTAPVMWFNQNGKIIVSMPGVPGEMKTAMKDSIIPRLQDKFVTGHILHKTIQVFNIPEAVLAEQLEEWESSIPAFISLAYLPGPGKIRLRLSAKTNDKQLAMQAFERLTLQLHELIGAHIFAEEDQPTHVLISEVFKLSGKTLATAESCTGGLISHLLTSVPGSSAYFRGAVVAYENEIKKAVLGVPSQKLEEHGAVSQEVVEAMALGVKKLMQTNYAIATSGIAGPTGGSDEKPVGTVWIAIAGDFGVISKKYNFGQIRGRNIQRSADSALIMLLQQLKH